MGWDAFIKGKRGGIIVNKDILLDFKKAAIAVAKKAGYSDIHITNNFVALDISDTGQMLNRAGIDAWDASKLFRVRDLKFNWDFSYTKEEAPYYWSARKAIEVCQKHDLTIKFSW
jgi:hypothetical protein